MISPGQRPGDLFCLMVTLRASHAAKRSDRWSFMFLPLLPTQAFDLVVIHKSEGDLALQAGRKDIA